MSGTLYVVATPIGNLEDITLRALRILREVAVIAAEDTRRTAKLLTHHAIPTPSVSFHEHNTRTRLPQLIARLERGENVAVVSDAGTPGVSDPGLELVQACIERGIRVDPLPGASATLTALVGSGFPVVPVTIFGFPPVKANARAMWFDQVARLAHTVVFFEAPHRIRAVLAEASRYLGRRPIALARELTKVHQEFLRGTAESLAETVKRPRGEFTVVIGPSVVEQEPSRALAPSDLAAEFGRLTEGLGYQRRAAISDLARRYGRTSREIYSMLETAKVSGNRPKLA
jgi:16S rRNA (cytidine1402-2'-O)-methyltransferase